MHGLASPPRSAFFASSIGRAHSPASPSREQASHGLSSAASELQSYPSPPMSDEPSPPPRARRYPQQKEKSDPSQDQHERRQEQGAEHEVPGSRSSGRLGAEPQRRLVYQGRGRPPSTTRAEHQPEIPPSTPHEALHPEETHASQMGPFGYPLGGTAAFNPGYGGGPTLQALHRPAPLATQVPLRNTKSARRNKAHVASACVNCKRAHLSCDVQRPCTRCVASGKEATCYDVQHKKRGRPRLRDVQEGRTQQHEPHVVRGSTSASESPAASISGFTGRHRSDSFRSLRSGRRSVGALSTMSLQPTSRPPLPEAAAIQYQPPEFQRLLLVTPMALLNLDLHIIKTNAAFNGLFGHGDMRGREIAELLEPGHAEFLQRLRGDLREERDTREPTYMAPIFAPRERETVHSVEEEDLDRITQRYTDRSFSWRFNSLLGHSQDVRVRVRLAKTSIFFVSLTLPPFPQPTNDVQPQHTFAAPAPPRHSRPSSRAALTPMSAEFNIPSYGQSSPLNLSEPPSPYSPYFSLSSMTASMPSAAIQTPAPSYHYGQPQPAPVGLGYAPASWSSSGSAEHMYHYQPAPRRLSAASEPREQWHNEPRYFAPPPHRHRRPQVQDDPGPLGQGGAVGPLRQGDESQQRRREREEDKSKRRRVDIQDII